VTRSSHLLSYGGPALLVVGLGYVHATNIGHYPFAGTSRFAWLVGYAILLCCSAYAAGLPDIARSLGGAMVSACAAGAAAAGVISIVQLLAGSLLLPRYVVIWGALGSVPLNVAASSIAKGSWRRQSGKDRILLIASPDEASVLRRDLLAPERPCVSVGSVLPSDDIRRAAAASGANVIVLNRAAAADPAVIDAVGDLHAQGLRVRTLSLFYEEWLGKLPLAELERVSLMFDIGELHRARYARFRRLIDLLLGTIGMAPLLVLTVVVGVGNALANRGPLLHRQERVGRSGKPFVILKFRTMRPGSDPTTWSVTDDERVTPFGGLLRRTHLDEMPQLFNVLRGDLSLVGPRPEQPHYVTRLRETVPFYDLRHLIRPGMTGWAQVKYGYGGNELGALEKLQYDFFYLRHQGLHLDARIIGRTLRINSGREVLGPVERLRPTRHRRHASDA
jgi:lipopolysaccharide/colanic/teichoic acid biosynthesis glycosyltransferase